MQKLLECSVKPKQYKIDKFDRAADGASAIHVYILNGKHTRR